MPPSMTITGAPSGRDARPHRRAEAGELRRASLNADGAGSHPFGLAQTHTAPSPCEAMLPWGPLGSDRPHRPLQAATCPGGRLRGHRPILSFARQL